MLEDNDAQFETGREILNLVSLSILESHLINLWLGEGDYIRYGSNSTELKGKGKWLLVRNVQPENAVEHMLGEAPSRVLGGWLGPGKSLMMEDGSVLESNMFNRMDR